MSGKWWFRNQTRKAYDEKYIKTGLPRCDKCFNCKEQHIKNYTEYMCNLENKNVNQSHFGCNSPKWCPLRKENKIYSI